MSAAILALAKAITQKESAVVATVVEINGASPAKVGAQVVLLANGSKAGTVGGGKLEASIKVDAQLPCITVSLFEPL